MSPHLYVFGEPYAGALLMCSERTLHLLPYPPTLLSASAGLRFSVRDRLLDVAGGVSDINAPRGSCGDGAFVVATQESEERLHSSTPPPPSPSAILCG